MKNIRNHFILNDFNIKTNKKNVFHRIDCDIDSPVFDIVNEEYKRLELELYSLIKPLALIKFSEDKGFIYVIITIGDGLSNLATRYFAEGDYLSGMLVNAMADEFLFQLEDPVQDFIKEECARRAIGVTCRLEAPSSMPMEMNKEILEETDANNNLGMTLTEAYMFSIVKTNAYMLEISNDPQCFNGHHSCDKCENRNCKMRKEERVKLILKKNNQDLYLEVFSNESVLDALTRQGVYISAICAGKGSCGKCKIRLVEGDLEVTKEDRNKFTETELEMGYRLACRAYPRQECKISIDSSDESDFEVVSDHSTFENDFVDDNLENNYFIGVDIGTTTIAMTLINSNSKKVVKSYTAINKQRAYGADVILRMKASNEGKGDLLQASIRKDLLKGIQTLVKEAKIDKKDISKIAIASNTTMGHLLMGYSCKTLGEHPYRPVNIDVIRKDFSEILASDYLNIPVILLPGISTFVGADIVAGLLVCEFHKKERPSMFIDLGTNGEMAIGNKDRILVSSTAAGPAFEGGNIQWGVGSVKGAISNVTIENKSVKYKTIGDKDPIGICGTGVIEITSELVKEGLIDETGLLVDEYFHEGYEIANVTEAIVFTQKDIREIQLAKSAIRAGVEVLIKGFGLSYEEVETVYLAGGFGFKLDTNKAIGIGLLPKEFGSKIKAIGNSSLAGAVKYLTDKTARESTDKILSVSKEISLSEDPDFYDLYVDYMYF